MENPEQDDHEREVMSAASEVIESAQANVLIEIEFAKAVRIGTLLRLWRHLMTDHSNAGSSFPEEWVDARALEIFRRFYPPMVEFEESDEDSEHDDDED